MLKIILLSLLFLSNSFSVLRAEGDKTSAERFLNKLPAVSLEVNRLLARSIDFSVNIKGKIRDLRNVSEIAKKTKINSKNLKAFIEKYNNEISNVTGQEFVSELLNKRGAIIKNVEQSAQTNYLHSLALNTISKISADAESKLTDKLVEEQLNSTKKVVGVIIKKNGERRHPMNLMN